MTTRIQALLLILTPVLGGCQNLGAEQSENNGSEVQEHSEHLWTSTTGYLPENGIEVCWSPLRFSVHPVTGASVWTAAPADDAEFIAYRDIIQPLVEQAYETIPGANVRFHGWDVCASRVTGASTGRVRVVVDLASLGTGSFRHCRPSPTDEVHGYADHTSCWGNPGYDPTAENTLFLQGNSALNDVQRTTALHEFGHLLNFNHELDRADSTQTNNGWVNCSARLPTASNQGITVYDPDSIMNGTYCHLRPSLSELDRLGLSITYPSSYSHQPDFSASFLLSNGHRLVPAYATVTVSWIRRGAGPAAFTARPRWVVNDAWRYTQDIIPVTGMYRVYGEFVDGRSRGHQVVSANVVVDTSRYAALALIAALR